MVQAPQLATAGKAITTKSTVTVAKSGAATIWSGKGLSLGLGLGLGALGPLLVIGATTAGYLAYKKHSAGKFIDLSI